MTSAVRVACHCQDRAGNNGTLARFPTQWIDHILKNFKEKKNSVSLLVYFFLSDSSLGEYHLDFMLRSDLRLLSLITLETLGDATGLKFDVLGYTRRIINFF